MPDLIRLQPHDPVPDSGRYILVLRRFGEDAPELTLTEIITADGVHPPMMAAAVRADGSGVPLEEAVHTALRQAEQSGCATVYVVDRTAGAREQEVLRHHGDHSVGMDRLVDEDGDDAGTSLRDRPRDAGYNVPRSG